MRGGFAAAHAHDPNSIKADVILAQARLAGPIPARRAGYRDRTQAASARLLAQRPAILSPLARPARGNIRRGGGAGRVLGRLPAADPARTRGSSQAWLGVRQRQ